MNIEDFFEKIENIKNESDLNDKCFVIDINNNLINIDDIYISVSGNLMIKINEEK